MRAILTYHSIDGSGSPVSVDAATFERHVRWLASGAVEVVPLAELPARPASSDAVALTFDDGFRSFAELAWPMLRERDLPATLFVVTSRVGGTNRWGGRSAPGIPDLPLCGWEELGRLADEGCELGCHSRTHADLSRLDGGRIADELGGSLADLEREAGVRAGSFAYPYGRFGPRAVEKVRDTFDRACTTELAALPADPDPHLLPRLDAFYYRTPGRLEAFGGPGFRLHVALRSAARRIRSRLFPLEGRGGGGGAASLPPAGRSD